MKCLRLFLLSVLALFMSLSVEANPNCKAKLTLGREPPKELGRHTLQLGLLEGVLKDQLKVGKPDHGVAYVFVSYWPGAVWEDFFNGGGQ